MTRMAYWYTREYHWQWITFTISFVQYNQFATLKGTYRQHFGDKIEFYCRMEIFCMFFCFSVRFVCGCTLTVLIWVFYLPSMNRLFRIFSRCMMFNFSIYGTILLALDVMISLWATYELHAKITTNSLTTNYWFVVYFFSLVSIKFPLCLQTDECFIEWPCLLFIEWSWFLLFFLFVHFCFIIWNDSESLA